MAYRDDGPEPEYEWLRKQGETARSYDAFRVYLNMGPGRTLAKAAEEVGKSTTLLEDWSSQWDWQARVRAFENHLLAAETDGHAEELARVKNKQLELTDKLLDHLSSRLDDYIAKNMDPTVRWVQAFAAATKAQLAAIQLRNEAGAEDPRIAELNARIDRLLQSR